MNIIQALRILNNGGSVTRRAWKNFAIALVHEEIFVCTRTRMVIALSYSDLMAQDWEYAS